MKFPWLATALVGVAVAVMIGLGVWQLQRAEWKRGLLELYAEAPRLPEVAWPVVPVKPEALYFRRATGFCMQVVGWRAVAGRNRRDQPGWSHIAACRTGAEGPGMQVDIGWSKGSGAPAWRGGEVRGIIAPDSKHALRLVASEAAPGLEPSAPPTRDSISNNHMMYAVQWFLFALIAAIIYVLALRKRRREGAAPADLPKTG
jgi:cytochrome oxidase assembly protein ShyY1